MDFLGNLLSPIQAIADSFAPEEKKAATLREQNRREVKHLILSAELGLSDAPRLPTRTASTQQKIWEGRELPPAWLQGDLAPRNRQPSPTQAFAHKNDVWRQHELQQSRTSSQESRADRNNRQSTLHRIVAEEKRVEQHPQDDDGLSGRSTPYVSPRPAVEDSWNVPASKRELPGHAYKRFPLTATERSAAAPLRAHSPQPQQQQQQPREVQVMYGAPQACSIVNFQSASIAGPLASRAPQQPSVVPTKPVELEGAGMKQTTFVRLTSCHGTVQVHQAQACPTMGLV